jgi:hypothetical protein
MQRVDVAIQSYKKPESLIYTLMSLHKVSGRHIEHVFINDDCSGGNISSIYLHESVKAFLKPWKIHFRENTHPVSWGEKCAMVRGYSPKCYNQWQIIRRHARALFKRDVHVTSPENIRYQWALRQSEKKFLFILHDDIEFYDDIVGLYLTRMCPGVAIVGDLGQCWRCGYGKQDPPCSPEKIVNKEFPSLNWPRTIPGQGQSSLDCRINEWCCMISREAALELERKERCFSEIMIWTVMWALIGFIRRSATGMGLTIRSRRGICAASIIGILGKVIPAIPCGWIKERGNPPMTGKR